MRETEVVSEADDQSRARRRIVPVVATSALG